MSDVLYRISSVRSIQGTALRHTAFRATKEGCDEYVKWLVKVGATDILVDVYKLVEQGVPICKKFKD